MDVNAATLPLGARLWFALLAHQFVVCSSILFRRGKFDEFTSLFNQDPAMRVVSWSLVVRAELLASLKGIAPVTCNNFVYVNIVASLTPRDEVVDC